MAIRTIPLRRRTQSVCAMCVGTMCVNTMCVGTMCVGVILCFGTCAQVPQTRRNEMQRMDEMSVVAHCLQPLFIANTFRKDAVASHAYGSDVYLYRLETDQLKPLRAGIGDYCQHSVCRPSTCKMLP